jgi:glycosyltransferase XagB
MTFLILVISLLLFSQSLFSVYLMLYSWEHPEKLEASKGPKTFLPAHHSFTVLLPARHEEAVIHDTIKRVWATNYPSHLLEIVVICHSDDTGTIAEARRAIDDIGSERIRVATFSEGPINKPHGLNVGFRNTTHEIITIFDAEDDIDADIFSVVNTIMQQEKVGIVQAGVQLMNFRDHWFSSHNCMEYFFWFKSRLHFHAKVGMIPLGGNTVFIRRDLMQRVGGWDEHCLTEDAEIGLRLSTLGEPIRVVYDMQHATREETPPDVASFVRQRTRWQQGFIQVLFKGTWLKLSGFDQRLLALYTLSYPFQQAVITLLWIPAVLSVFWLRLPASIALLSFLPLYSLLLQFLTTVVGAYMFTREYHLKFPLHLPLSMALTFLPFHWLLGISAIRAALRELSRQQDWEKTAHLGAHRQSSAVTTTLQQALPQANMTLLNNILNENDVPLKNFAHTEARDLIAVAQERIGYLPSIASAMPKDPFDSIFTYTEPLTVHLTQQIEALKIIRNENLDTTHPMEIQEAAIPHMKIEASQHAIDEQEASQQIDPSDNNVYDSPTEQATDNEVAESVEQQESEINEDTKRLSISPKIPI